METVVSNAMINLDVLIRETGAEIEYGELPTVTGDALQLLQLIQNLIGNALKYRRPDVRPRVRLSARQDGPNWVFAVEDNGEGISLQYQQNIFEPFKRLHSGEVPGTGMGLALCKKVVERHAGRLWVQSEPGIGSTFFVCLPAGVI
jgi:signal transduction histidine kinase